MEQTESKQTKQLFEAGEIVKEYGIYRCNGKLGQTKFLDIGYTLPKCTCSDKRDCKWSLDNY